MLLHSCQETIIFLFIYLFIYYIFFLLRNYVEYLSDDCSQELSLPLPIRVSFYFCPYIPSIHAQSLSQSSSPFFHVLKHFVLPLHQVALLHPLPLSYSCHILFINLLPGILYMRPNHFSVLHLTLSFTPHSITSPLLDTPFIFFLYIFITFTIHSPSPTSSSQVTFLLLASLIFDFHSTLMFHLHKRQYNYSITVPFPLPYLHLFHYTLDSTTFLPCITLISPSMLAQDQTKILKLMYFLHSFSIQSNFMLFWKFNSDPNIITLLLHGIKHIYQLFLKSPLIFHDQNCFIGIGLLLLLLLLFIYLFID